MNWRQLLDQISSGNIKTLARVITLVENEYNGYETLLQLLPNTFTAKTIGITGPPGAGKSTLVDSLIGLLVNQGKKVAVLCVDPSSPFNKGALLGDRIRMNEWYNHPHVFIRSLATRGSLGGLHPKIIEINDIVKAAAFDYIIIETVGVGQSEVEIAGLADVTVVVLVPESGDAIQVMKAGLMEIADIFAVNKSDRPDANTFIHTLQSMLLPDYGHYKNSIPVVKTIATQHTGINELLTEITVCLQDAQQPRHKYLLLAEKAWQLIINKRMRNLSKMEIADMIKEKSAEETFNLYRFIDTL